MSTVPLPDNKNTSADALFGCQLSCWKCDSESPHQWKLPIKRGDSLKETGILLVCDGFPPTRKWQWNFPKLKVSLKWKAEEQTREAALLTWLNGSVALVYSRLKKYVYARLYLYSHPLTVSWGLSVHNSPIFPWSPAENMCATYMHNISVYVSVCVCMCGEVCMHKSAGQVHIKIFVM